MPASKWNSKWTSKCASRQSGVHFFISYTIRWLRTRRFSEPTFRASGLRNPKTLEERIVSRLLYLFAHLHLLSSDSFSSLILFLLLLFSPLTLPTAAFPSVHIVGSLTSKLPSAIYSDMLQLHQKLVAAGLRAKHIPKAVIRAGFLFAKDHIESCTSPAGHKLGKLSCNKHWLALPKTCRSGYEKVENANIKQWNRPFRHLRFSQVR